MKFIRSSLRVVVFLSCVAVLTAAANGAENVTTTSVEPIPTEARCLALETAGAFMNDGFRVRDAEWPFTLTKKSPLFLQVTLFAGNRYWFVTASPTPGATLRVTLYDEKGQPLKNEQWEDGGAHGGSRGAAGIAPDQSGHYFVGVEILQNPSDLPLDCSLVIAYK